eukprot:2646217-Rhodomonas_salina.1
MHYALSGTALLVLIRMPYALSGTAIRAARYCPTLRPHTKTPHALLPVKELEARTTSALALHQPRALLSLPPSQPSLQTPANLTAAPPLPPPLPPPDQSHHHSVQPPPQHLRVGSALEGVGLQAEEEGEKEGGRKEEEREERPSALELEMQ